MINCIWFEVNIDLLLLMGMCSPPAELSVVIIAIRYVVFITFLIVLEDFEDDWLLSTSGCLFSFQLFFFFLDWKGDNIWLGLHWVIWTTLRQSRRFWHQLTFSGWIKIHFLPPCKCRGHLKLTHASVFLGSNLGKGLKGAKVLHSAKTCRTKRCHLHSGLKCNRKDFFVQKKAKHPAHILQFCLFG